MYQLCRSETFCFKNITLRSRQSPACEKDFFVIIKADRKGISGFSIFRKLDFTDPKGTEWVYNACYTRTDQPNC